MTKGYFITGTGTNVGKTVATCALMRQWRSEGRRVEAIKPVMSGGIGDAEALLSAQGREVTPQNIAAISPWRYKAPLAPHLAAAKEGKSLALEEVVKFSRKAQEKSDAEYFLIEGAGGVMSPLDGKGHTMLDWLEALHLPVILVAGNHVGSISHTLTALLALQSRKLEVNRIVVSHCDLYSAMSAEETVKELQRYVHQRIEIIPRLLDNERQMAIR